MKESVKTLLLAGIALVLAISAAVIEPESHVPKIMSDQGQAFYPDFTDPQAPRTIEVVDYDESTATAMPLKVQFQQGKWLITSHFNYPVDIGDRLAKTAAALIDLKKDIVRSDSPLDQGKFGVIDPLDEKSGSLTGRGKRVTLRDARNNLLADFILGKPVEGKAGFRYVRVPGQKRIYAVKTDADPSARFADWVNSGLLRISSGSIRKVTIRRYNLQQIMSGSGAMDTTVLTQEKGEWKTASGSKPDMALVKAMATALDSLKIVDVRPKPAGLAAGLRKQGIDLNVETAMSLQQKGFFVTEAGQIYSAEGDIAVETNNGLVYKLFFGNVAESETAKPGAAGDNRQLWVILMFDPAKAASYGGDAAAGEKSSRDLNAHFADWYYVISGKDFQTLRLGRGPTASAAPAPPMPGAPPPGPHPPAQ